MQTNQFKTIRLFVGYSEGMHSVVNSKIAWVILLSALLSKGAFAFSIGEANGLNCGYPKPIISCSAATFFVGDNQFETVHQNITRDALTQINVSTNQPYVIFKSYNKSFSGGSLTGNPILEIETGNFETDYDQTNHEKHFDNENIAFGSQRLQGGLKFITQKLAQSSILSKTEALLLRKEFGGYVHTLQDFFSHTNWVQIHPGLSNIPIPSLWKSTMAVYPISAISTCLIPGRNISPVGILGDNYPPTSGVLSEAGYSNVTSGYAWNPLGDAKAPYGKCAHGLVGNGIHKDWSTRDFHPEAREQATYATQEFANDVINDPNNNPDNVCMFMTDQPCGAKLTVTVNGSGYVTYSLPTISGRDRCDSGTSPCTEYFNVSDGQQINLTAHNSDGTAATSATWSGTGMSTGSCTGATVTCGVNLDHANNPSPNINVLIQQECATPRFNKITTNYIAGTTTNGPTVIFYAHFACMPKNIYLETRHTITFGGTCFVCNEPGRIKFDESNGPITDQILPLGAFGVDASGTSISITLSIILPDKDGKQNGELVTITQSSN